MFSRLPPIQSHLKVLGVGLINGSEHAATCSCNEHVRMYAHPSEGGFVITVDSVSDCSII